jgi:hypothetical protein
LVLPHWRTCKATDLGFSSIDIRRKSDGPEQLESQCAIVALERDHEARTSPRFAVSPPSKALSWLEIYGCQVGLTEAFGAAKLAS